MSFDPKCYEIAECFLEDTPRLYNDKVRAKLAQTIQDVIEDFISDDDNFPQPLPPDNRREL